MKIWFINSAFSKALLNGTIVCLSFLNYLQAKIQGALKILGHRRNETNFDTQSGFKPIFQHY